MVEPTETEDSDDLGVSLGPVNEWHGVVAPGVGPAWDEYPTLILSEAYRAGYGRVSVVVKPNPVSR